LNQNPYQAPIDSTADAAKLGDASRIVAFRPLVMKWEKYRLVYNTALVVTTIFCMLAFGVSPLDIVFWFCVFWGACAANILFMLGPSLDGYLQVAGLRHRVIGLFAAA